MADNAEIILQPRLSGFGYDDKELQKDLSRLQNLLNQKGGLQVKLGLDKAIDSDINALVSKIKSQLTQIQNTSKIKLEGITSNNDINVLKAQAIELKKQEQVALDVVGAFTQLQKVFPNEIGKLFDEKTISEISNVQSGLIDTRVLIESITDRINVIQFKPEIESTKKEQIDDVVKDAENKTNPIKIKTEVDDSNLKSDFSDIVNEIEKSIKVSEKKSEVSYKARQNEKGNFVQLNNERKELEKLIDLKQKYIETGATGLKEEDAEYLNNITAIYDGVIKKLLNVGELHGKNINLVKTESSAYSELAKSLPDLTANATSIQTEKKSVDEVREAYEKWLVALTEVEQKKAKTALTREAKIFSEKDSAKDLLPEDYDRVFEKINENFRSSIGGWSFDLRPFIEQWREAKVVIDESAGSIKNIGEQDLTQNTKSEEIKVGTESIDDNTEAIKRNTQAQRDNANVPSPTIPTPIEAPTAPENKGFEQTNALTKEHIDLMEQAANAELEKLEISKKLANALLDEEGAFKAVGKAADDADKKAKDVGSISIGEFESEGARVSKRPMTQATADMNTHKKAILDANNAENLRSQTAQNNAKIEVQQSKLREQAKKEEISTIRASVQEEKLQNDILLQNIKLQQQTANLLKHQANDLSKQMQAFDKLDTDVEGYKEAGVAIGNLKSAFDELGKARGLEQLEESATKFNIALIEAKDSISKVQQIMKTESTQNKDLLQTQVDDAKKELSGLDDELKKIAQNKDITKEAISKESLQRIGEITDRVDALKVELGDKMPSTTGIDKSLKAASDNANSFAQNMSDLVDKGTKVDNEIKKIERDWSAIKTDSKLSKEFKDIKQSLEQWKLNPTKEGLDDITRSVSLFKSEAQGLGKNVLSLGDLISATFKRLLSYNIANMFIGGIKTAISQSIKDIKDIENQLTQLSKVTDITKEDFKELTIEALNSANKWGKTASDYLKAVETFAKAGKANREELAEISILAQSAGDITAELANKFLITADAAFQLNGSSEKLTSLLDSMNQVTNRNAVTMEDMAEATSVYANTANIAGESTQTMTALIATGIGATQRSGSEIARALRTLTLNIRQIKGETEDGVFDESTFGKAEQSLANIGIRTREVVNGIVELKTASQVISELAEKFQAGQLSAEQLSLVMENVATKRQADLLAAIVQNFSLYSKAMSDFENASGSAASEAQKELESWQGKLNVLQNNWTAFVANFVDTGWIKTGIDGLSGLVKTLDTAPGKMAVTTAGVIALVGAMRSIKEIPAIQTIGKTFQDIGKQAA